MANVTRMKFVGGQEDGRFYDVRDDVDMMNFYEELDLDNVPFVADNPAPVNDTRKIIRYVRQGDLMAIECESE